MMSNERLVSLRNPWFVTSVGATLVLFLFSAFVGFCVVAVCPEGCPVPGAVECNL